MLMLEPSHGFLVIVLSVGAAVAGVAGTKAARQPGTEEIADTIIDIEKAALDRWGHGDPGGYLEIAAPEITYFDPSLERRLDGGAAFNELLEPLRGRIRVDRFEMLDPAVQVHGDSALLSFNLLSFRTGEDGQEQVISRWNSTEVYALLDGRWQLIHSHWSYIKPELKDQASEVMPE